MLILSIVIAILLLYFSLRDLDWVVFWNTLRSGQYWIAGIVLPIVTINYFLRACRWKLLIDINRKIPVLPVFWANMAGYMGNAFLPARAGELIRSGFLGEKSGLGMSFVLATALVERLLDVITLVLVGSMALLFNSNMQPAIIRTAGWMAVLGLSGLIIIFLLPSQENRVLGIINHLPFADPVKHFIAYQISRFTLGTRALHNGRRLAGFAVFTATIWTIDAFANTLGVGIISQTLRMDQAFILLAALGLSSAIPSTPGYIGVYQFVAILVLVPFGFSRSEALAYILISQVLGTIVISLWGLVGLWQINLMQKFEDHEKGIGEQHTGERI